MLEPLLQLENVTFQSEGRPVFPGTSWVWEPGQHWAILGPNGSGKSLLVRAIAGELPLSEGEIRFGKPLLSSPDSLDSYPEPAVAVVSSQRQCEVVTGESSFYQSRWHDNMGEGTSRVSDYLSQDAVEQINPFECNPNRGSRHRFCQRKTLLRWELRLDELWSRLLIQLSHGEMRRVLLARALLQFPRLLILDEPFAGLDVENRRCWGKWLNSLTGPDFKILMASSRPEGLLPSTTHVLLVEKHRLIARGTWKRLRRHPLVRSMAPLSRPSGVPQKRPIDLKKSSGNTDHSVLVEMRRVDLKYGRKVVLSNFHWTIREGEHWALLGPNGSGKSTLLSLIQVDNPHVYGQDILLFGLRPEPGIGLWRVRRHLGWYCPELQMHFPSDQTCLAVVSSGFSSTLGLYDRTSPRQRQQAREWLARFNLIDAAARPLSALSAGDQRLVLLARALVKRPRLLLLDEPCQGLDGGHRELVLEAIDQVVLETGATLVFTTHYPQEMPRCIQRILVLPQRRLRFSQRTKG